MRINSQISASSPELWPKPYIWNHLDVLEAPQGYPLQNLTSHFELADSPSVWAMQNRSSPQRQKREMVSIWGHSPVPISCTIEQKGIRVKSRDLDGIQMKPCVINEVLFIFMTIHLSWTPGVDCHFISLVHSFILSFFLLSPPPQTLNPSSLTSLPPLTFWSCQNRVPRDCHIYPPTANIPIFFLFSLIIMKEPFLLLRPTPLCVYCIPKASRLLHW